MKTNKIYVSIAFFVFLVASCKKIDENPEPSANPLNESISAIARVANTIWIGTSHKGLFKLENNSWFQFSQSEGFLSDTITCLATDNQGRVWVGTNRGVSKIENDTWENYTTENGLFNNEIRSLGCDITGNIWIGTRKNRLVRFDGENFSTFHINPEASGPGQLGHVHSVTSDFNGNLWVGSCISGLSRYDGLEWFDYVSNLTSFVNCSALSENGELWVGHYTGAYRFANNAWTHFSESDGLIYDIVNCFAFDDGGNVWVGTMQGLSMFDGESWVSFTIEDGLGSNNITALTCDHNGDVWIGTPNGINTINQPKK